MKMKKKENNQKSLKVCLTKRSVKEVSFRISKNENKIYFHFHCEISRAS